MSKTGFTQDPSLTIGDAIGILKRARNKADFDGVDYDVQAALALLEMAKAMIRQAETGLLIYGETKTSAKP